MTAPLRRGWCPGALRPMLAKDGLLVRLRITGGILPAEKAWALADLAEKFGSGLFDLSARGNLQLRGVREATLEGLQDALWALGIIDEDATGEAVRNVIASPLAGIGGDIDIRPLTKELERRLLADVALQTLPAKFGFLIDDGRSPSLASVGADVRFDWTGCDFSIGLGGDAVDAVRIGNCVPADLVGEATRLARIFVDRFASTPNIRRMHQVGKVDLEDAFGSTRSSPAPCKGILPTEVKISPHGMVGFQSGISAVSVSFFGLAAPFGRLDSRTMRAAASTAANTALGELRLTPWRVILVPGAARGADVTGFITDPNDPRLAVAACVGIDGCDRGSTRTREDGERLARDLALQTADGIALHVSGCRKGCAKATSSPFTLVAQDGRYDVVRNGRASDPAWREGLELDDVGKLLTAESQAA